MEILLSITSKADGSAREVRSAIGEGLVVGRGAEGGVLLEGPDLSREHLVLTADGPDLYLTDLSSNGTWLNGNRLRRSITSRVRPGDSIEVPGYALSFQLAEQPEKKADEPAKPQLPQPIFEESPSPPVAEAARPAGMLAPLFGFIGSFTFGEKFLVLVGLGGLLLLYTYVAS